MRSLSLLLLLSFFSLTLPACAQKGPAQKTKAKKAATARNTAPNAAAPVIVFERTPCFGTCPSYLMQVFADGRVAYEGRRFVAVAGKKDLRLPAATVADLLQQAQTARFDTFASSYPSGATDLPSTIISIRQPDGTLKKVTVEGNGPENVHELFASFSSQFDALAQPKATEK